MRIQSRPVCRTVRGITRHIPIGDVDVTAEMEFGQDGLQVRHGVFSLPNGATGVVLRIDDEGEQWLASAGGDWLPEVFDGLHPAVWAATEGTVR